MFSYWLMPLATCLLVLSVLWVILLVLTDKQLFDLCIIKMLPSPEKEIFFIFAFLHRQNRYKHKEEGY